MEYASKAVGTAGLTTGIAGTALGLLGMKSTQQKKARIMLFMPQA